MVVDIVDMDLERQLRFCSRFIFLPAIMLTPLGSFLSKKITPLLIVVFFFRCVCHKKVS